MTLTRIPRIGIVASSPRAHDIGPGIRPDEADREAPRMVVACPRCGEWVPCPGTVRGGAQALAECVPCDLYFDFDAAEVRLSEPIGSGPSLGHPVIHLGHRS